MATRRDSDKFATEAEMCARFLADIGQDWTPYAETAGWDILLARKADGLQIGVQAKLQMNAHVVSQALDERYGFGIVGPDYRAILVPFYATPFSEKICAHVGVTIVRVSKEVPQNVYPKRCFRPALPSIDDRWTQEDWFEWCPEKRCALPEYVPDCAAGTPSPIQLTKWKISAIKIAIILEKRGFVTRSDFKNVGIDIRRWTDGAWLAPGERGYVAGPYFPKLRQQHPRVFEEIAADYEKWAPPVVEAAKQGALL